MEAVIGGQAADLLIGNDARNALAGDSGDDSLRGEGGNDDLRGNSGGDTLSGGDGDDLVVAGAGNDFVLAGAGDDSIVAGDGDDVVHPQAGKDRLLAGDGDDVVFAGGVENDGYVGGNGFDTLDYAVRLTPIFVNAIAATGGLNGSEDQIEGFEAVRGGKGNDTILGLSSLGNDGDDTLSGGSGGDAIDGGPDVDALRGLAGSDFLDARDGISDSLIDCGTGSQDSAELDLKDPAALSCEFVTRFALDDGPPAQTTNQRARVLRDGRVVVQVTCPRNARIGCRGTLRLRHPRSGQALAQSRYRLGLGQKTAVSLTARRRLPGRIIAATSEQGVSKKGPRSSTRLLRVAR